MASVTIEKGSLADLNRLVGDIKNGAKKILVVSINKAMKTTQTQAVKIIGQDLNLPAKRIKQDFKDDKANFSTLRGSLRATGDPVGLINFAAISKVAGVSVKVKKAGSRSIIPHTFMALAKNGRHVFMRLRDNLPAPTVFDKGKLAFAPWPQMGDKYRGIINKKATNVTRKTGPRIEDIYGEKKNFDRIQKIAVDAYLKNIETQTASILRRYG